MTPEGKVSEYSMPAGVPPAALITSSPGGVLWFVTEPAATTQAPVVGQISLEGKIVTHAIPEFSPVIWASAIAADSSGFLWIFQRGGAGAVRVDAAGDAQFISLPSQGQLSTSTQSAVWIADDYAFADITPGALLKPGAYPWEPLEIAPGVMSANA
jgi:hypothetical protein